MNINTYANTTHKISNPESTYAIILGDATKLLKVNWQYFRRHLAVYSAHNIDCIMQHGMELGSGWRHCCPMLYMYCMSVCMYVCMSVCDWCTNDQVLLAWIPRFSLKVRFKVKVVVVKVKVVQTCSHSVFIHKHFSRTHTTHTYTHTHLHTQAIPSSHLGHNSHCTSLPWLFYLN